MTTQHPTPTPSFYDDFDATTREALAAMTPQRREALIALNDQHARDLTALVSAADDSLAPAAKMTPRQLLDIFLLTHDALQQQHENERAIENDARNFDIWKDRCLRVALALRAALTPGLLAALQLEFAPFIGETAIHLRVTIPARDPRHPALVATLRTVNAETLYVQEIEAPYELDADGRDAYTNTPTIPCSTHWTNEPQAVVDALAYFIQWMQKRIAWIQGQVATEAAPTPPFHPTLISQVLSAHQRVVCTPVRFNGPGAGVTDDEWIGELTDVDWTNGLIALDDGTRLHVLPLRAFVVTRLDDAPPSAS